MVINGLCQFEYEDITMLIVLIHISNVHVMDVSHLLQVELGVVSLGLNNTLICDRSTLRP